MYFTKISRTTSRPDAGLDRFGVAGVSEFDADNSGGDR